MKQLPILWQRLTDTEGKTCPRCGQTYQELQNAFEKIKVALAPLGIEPTLETKEINKDSFHGKPLESNRVWIAGKPIEEWISAQVGSSPCCSVCGDSGCRTLQIEGTTFEVIPEELFIKAALLASSDLLNALPNTTSPKRSDTEESQTKCC